MLRERNGELFDTDISSSEDLDVTLLSRKLIERYGLSLGCLDKAVYVWRNHDGNITSSINGLRAMMVSRYVYRKNGFKIPDNLSWKSLFLRPGFWLPSKVKKHLVPAKNLARRLSGGKLYPNSHTESEFDINPYWFRRETSLTTS